MVQLLFVHKLCIVYFFLDVRKTLIYAAWCGSESVLKLANQYIETQTLGRMTIGRLDVFEWTYIIIKK